MEENAAYLGESAVFFFQKMFHYLPKVSYQINKFPGTFPPRSFISISSCALGKKKNTDKSLPKNRSNYSSPFLTRTNYRASLRPLKKKKKKTTEFRRQLKLAPATPIPQRKRWKIFLWRIRSYVRMVYQTENPLVSVYENWKRRKFQRGNLVLFSVSLLPRMLNAYTEGMWHLNCNPSGVTNGRRS